MEHETMDLEQLASYLQRDVREVSKMASRGHLPGQKVAGQWRFTSVEINHWIETQLHGYTDEQLSALETRAAGAEPYLSIAALLTDATMAVPLHARTRASVLKELVVLAEQSWQVYDPQAILHAIKQREDMGTTALSCGVAFPHPHRPLPAALGETVLAYGRTASAVPFGGPHGSLTDIFFLVCCPDQATHLRILARLSRMLLQPGLLDQLRGAETTSETRQILADAELQLVEG
jgi:PTS system nitrogen regulatory IIA component